MVEHRGQLPAGKVYLVGAGPGDLDYLTVRGDEVLRQAEALVYDALVDEALLQRIPADCETWHVGKRGGQPSKAQAEIDQLLVDLCLQGKQVVRLKSGDPFVFGRAASEIEALQAAGCAFEVVPGISSALAAPLLAGIPLTDPVLSRSFAVATAHDPDALDWEALSRLETLVILMGAQQLDGIVARLVQQGRSPQTPIAVIRWAGHPQQQVWTGTLQTIGQQTARQSLSPAVIVVGEVVALRPFLLPKQPQTRRLEGDRVSSHVPMFVPLAGKTILTTRAAGQSSLFTTLLQEQGATVIEMPAIAITPPSCWDRLDEAIANLSAYDWLILTSTNGVESFFERLSAQGKDARALAGIKVAVVGKKTAAMLKQQGIQPDFVPPHFVADSLVETFPELPAGLRLLFPRVETGGREVLVQEFTTRGAMVTEVPAYQSGCATEMPQEAIAALQQGRVDVITFASSKTVQCFHQLLRAALPDDSLQPLQPLLASIGPQTSITCCELFGRVDVEAKEFTLEGLTAAIVRYFESSRNSISTAL